MGLTQIASVTKTIKLGTNVVPIYTRTPTDLAMSVITVNEATGGRFRLLGIGAGGQLKIEPNHGVKVEKTAERTKEYIEIIRGILAGQRLSYRGRFFQLDNAWVPQTYGIGTAASDLVHGEKVPIYVGATGPRVLKVAGAFADGVIFNSLSTPEYIEWAKGVIGEGAKEAGLGDWHARVRETYLKGDIDGALELIDDDILHRIAFTGTPEEVRKKVEEYGKLGISLAVIRNVVDKKTGKGPVMDNIEAMALLIR